MILYGQDWRDYETLAKTRRDISNDGELYAIREYQHAVQHSFDEEIYPVGSNSQYRLFNTYGAFSSGDNHYETRVSESGLKVICFSFVCKTLSFRNSNRLGFYLSRSLTDAEMDSATGYKDSGYGIEIYPTSDEIYPQIVHTIQTSLTAKNSLVVARGPSLRADEFYQFDVKFDITNSLATCVLYVNGDKVIEQNFDRDRIVNAYPEVDVRSLKILMPGTYAGLKVANLCVYTDDALTPFPLGPLEIGRISPTSGPDYALVDYDPNASDGGWHVMNPGEETVWQLGDIPPGNPVLHAEMRGRVAAGGGFTPAVMDIELQRAGGGISAAVSKTSPAASFERQFRVKIPLEDANIATLNGARIAVRARTEN